MARSALAVVFVLAASALRCSESVPPLPDGTVDRVGGDCALEEAGRYDYFISSGSTLACIDGAEVDSLQFEQFSFAPGRVRMWRGGGGVAFAMRGASSENAIVVVDPSNSRARTIGGIPGDLGAVHHDDATGLTYAISTETASDGTHTSVTVLDQTLNVTDSRRVETGEDAFLVLATDVAPSQRLLAAAYFRLVPRGDGSLEAEGVTRLLLFDVARGTARQLDVALPTATADLALSASGTAVFLSTLDGVVRRYDLATGAVQTVVDTGPAPDPFTANRLIVDEAAGRYLAHTHDGATTTLYVFDDAGTISGTFSIPGVYRYPDLAGGTLCLRAFDARWFYENGPAQPEVFAQVRPTDGVVLRQDTVRLDRRFMEFGAFSCGG